MEQYPHEPSPVRQPYVSPAGNGYMPTPSQPPRERRTTDRRDVVFACILLVLSLLCANASVFGGFHLGHALGYGALLVGGGIYLARSRRLRPTPYALFCLLAAVAGLGVFVWHNDPLSLFLTYAGSLYLTMQALVEATDSARRDSGTVASAADVLSMLAARPLNNLGVAVPALFYAQQEEQVKKRRCGGVLLGLLCALPVLLVLLPLLIGADAAFEGLMEKTVLDKGGELLATVLLGCGLFCIIFSRLYTLRYRLQADKAPAAATRRTVDRLAVNAFLGVIVGLYGVFLLSQLAYFSSAFAGILPEAYTVAEYARRGFFEMCAVSAINLLLVAVVLHLSRKEAGKAPRSTRLLCLFVLLFSIGMVAAALAKMCLYVGSFGMTRLRVLTGVFMLMLGLVLLYVCIRLFAARFPYMRATVITVALLGLVTAYMDVDTTIARYNVEAYQSGALDTVDVETLARLSDGAVPYLLELCDDEDPQVAKEATRVCCSKLEMMERQLWRFPWEEDGLRAFNADAYRAVTLLKENADRLTRQQEHQNSVAPLQEELGEYYRTQQIDKLGEVAVRGGAETATVYHARYTDSVTEVSVVLGDNRVTTTYLSKPNEMGIYIVAGGEVLTLEQAYYSDTVYMEDVYALLPVGMWAEDVAW